MTTDLNTVIKIHFTSFFKYLESYFRSSPRQLEVREHSAELALILHPQCLVLTIDCFTFLHI